jgi:hypothetical protein
MRRDLPLQLSNMLKSMWAARTHPGPRMFGRAVAQLGARCVDYRVCSSRVRATASDLIAGAASRTIGNIVTQAINQDTSQCQKKLPVVSDGKLAMPAAIKHVSPDWMTAKTKWL